MITEEVKEKYTEVQGVLDEALKTANMVQITGEKENVELLEIKRTLVALNTEFKKEIDKLENTTEWDRFCIAFFGETNAGKSTIIDALRIIYDEETRRAEILAQEKEYRNRLEEHCDNYRSLISSLEEVNVSLQKRASQKKWIWYVVSGIAGLAVGLILANLGISLW